MQILDQSQQKNKKQKTEILAMEIK